MAWNAGTRDSEHLRWDLDGSRTVSPGGWPILRGSRISTIRSPDRSWRQLVPVVRKGRGKVGFTESRHLLTPRGCGIRGRGLRLLLTGGYVTPSCFLRMTNEALDQVPGPDPNSSHCLRDRYSRQSEPWFGRAGLNQANAIWSLTAEGSESALFWASSGAGPRRRESLMDRLVRDLRVEAMRLGFQDLGICSPAASQHLQAFRSWLNRSFHGEMAYLARADAVARRGDLRGTMEDVRSLVVLTQNHFLPDSPGMPEDPARGVISRYARGQDYHDLVKQRLQDLLEWLRTEVRSRGLGRGCSGFPLCGYGPDPGTGIGGTSWVGVVRKEHHADPSQAWILLLPRFVASRPPPSRGFSF